MRKSVIPATSSSSFYRFCDGWSTGKEATACFTFRLHVGMHLTMVLLTHGSSLNILPLAADDNSKPVIEVEAIAVGRDPCKRLVNRLRGLQTRKYDSFQSVNDAE